MGVDLKGARSSSSSTGRAAVPAPSAEERDSRLHKCPVRRRGSRLGSEMSLWVRLLALLVACLRVSGAAGVSFTHVIKYIAICILHALQMQTLQDSVFLLRFSFLCLLCFFPFYFIILHTIVLFSALVLDILLSLFGQMWTPIEFTKKQKKTFPQVFSFKQSTCTSTSTAIGENHKADYDNITHLFIFIP